VLLTVVLVVFSAPKAKNSIVTPALAPQKITKMASSKDISAIAGDDLVSTQLDLAKAYMEMGQTNLAKRILNETLKVGDPAQKSAARQLIETL
jgi:pilus assembly protein FimV